MTTTLRPDRNDPRYVDDSRNRDSSVRLLARQPLPMATLDKDAVLRAYLSRVQA